MGKGTNYVPEPSPVAGSISEEKGRKPKSIVSLGKPSHVMMTHSKIKMPYDFCKAINILCL